MVTAAIAISNGDLLCAREVNDKRYHAFEGRIKDVIDRGGEKINCQEIERVLLKHPAVLSAALVAMPDEDSALLVDLPATMVALRI